jgi:SAM-dependent methyltransferase
MIHGVSGKMRRVARRIMRRHSSSQKVLNGERPADWYDGRYVATAEYHKHYTESVYYPSWTLITDRLRQLESRSVLDIGCGSGQFGAMLRDGGIAKYRGLAS